VTGFVTASPAHNQATTMTILLAAAAALLLILIASAPLAPRPVRARIAAKRRRNR